MLLETRSRIRKLDPSRLNPLTARLRVNEHLEVLDEKFNPLSGVYAIGDNAMPVSGRLPATAQGERRTEAFMAQADDSRLADGQVHVQDAQCVGDGLKDTGLPGIQVEEQGQHGPYRR